MDDTSNEEALAQAILELGRLTRLFSQVHRGAPLCEHGTPESDTDHTVMLSLVACSVAAEYLPKLDIGKVAQYALVHDLVEAYCGDTNTIVRTKADDRAKKKREAKALADLRAKHSFFPWLVATLDAYETVENPEVSLDPEALFVKAIDKAMPAVLHNLNDGFIFQRGRPHFDEPVQFQEEIWKKGRKLRANEWAKDQDFPLRIREILMERVISRHWAKYGAEESRRGQQTSGADPRTSGGTP